MKKIRTHYDNLKVARNAPPEIIRAAYKTLSQKHHPDRHGNSAKSQQVMKIINKSYSVLIDPEERKKHDEWIVEQESLSSNNEGFKNADSLTRWVKIMLYAQIVVSVVWILSGYLEYELLSDYQNGVYISQEKAVADGEENAKREEIIGIVSLVISVISGFLILRWIHRANYNARQLGAENMKFTPWRSIGYYFLPIFNLWRPYQAMKEIWKAS